MIGQGNLKIIVLLKTIQVTGLVSNTLNKHQAAFHMPFPRPSLPESIVAGQQLRESLSPS